MVLNAVNQVILGKKELTEKIMMVILAGGHVLLEDIPGVGKTTLAVAFAKTLGLSWKRVQFTPDVLPSDLTGFSIYRREKEDFVYQPGAVFCNLLLADEINRTSPKTQSALLEVMEEKQVTADGVSRAVPCPFYVIATQNPAGAAGTQMLPPAQVDRFMVSLSMGYPSFDDEVQMAKEADEGRRTDNLRAEANPEILRNMQREVSQIYLHDTIYQYIASLVAETRTHEYLELGASPRATIALVKMSRAMAWLQGSEYVTPIQAASLARDVLNHRILLNGRARREKISRETIIEEIVERIPKPVMRNKYR